jgi:hypothetical protein
VMGCDGDDPCYSSGRVCSGREARHSRRSRAWQPESRHGRKQLVREASTDAWEELEGGSSSTRAHACSDTDEMKGGAWEHTYGTPGC